MKQFLTHLFSGKDNQTVDLGRVMWAGLVVSYVGATFVAVFQDNKNIDYALWAVGAGTLLAAGAGGLALKHKTEPEDKDGNGIPDHLEGKK
jgi:hypothetical protein